MIDERQNLSILIDIQWQDDFAHYTDQYFLLKTNFWRDFYPAKFDYQIKRAELNETLSIKYAPGELMESEFHKHNIIKISKDQFNQFYGGPIAIIPTIGRFYPRGMLDDVPDCFKLDNRPFRLVDIDNDNDTLTVDLNHPLADQALTLTATITDVFDANQQNGGRCNEIAELITFNGPGLQRLLADQPFDFSQNMPFARTMEDDDTTFYDALETQPIVDRVALEQLTQYYAKFIKDNDKVLDLMAGPDSFYPNDLKNIQLTVLGVKEKDLNDNPRAQQRIVHNVNQQTELNFADQSFDIVSCAFAVEYMTQPIELFKQIHRILKPGGLFIVSFSDLFFSQKATRLWHDLHAFERPGIVLEYFRQSGFEQMDYQSIRGLIRHDDDPFKNKTVHSCPMFMLSGKKAL